LHNAGDLNTLVDAAYSLAASALAGYMSFQPVNPSWNTFARLAGDFKNL
jgi:hypothetical protein